MTIVVISAIGQIATVFYLGTSVSGGDAFTYLIIADDWLTLERLFSPSAFEANFWPAGYSGFLALFAWAGDQQVILVRVAHVVMAAGIALMAGRWVDRIRRSAGTITVALVAFSPTMLWAVWAIGYELLLAFLLAAGVSILWQPGSQRAASWSVLGGLLLGLALIVQFRAVLAVIALLVMVSRTDRRAGIFGLIGVLVPIAAWAVRSFVATGSAVPWSANGPYNLWNGNNPEATGRNIFPLPALPDGADSYSSAAIEWILANPGLFLSLTARKFAYLFEPSQIARVTDPFPGEILVTTLEFALAAFIIAMLAVFVVARIRGRLPGLKALDVLFVCTMAYLLPNIIFIVETRFAIPVHAMLVALSVGTLSALFQHYSRLREMRISGIRLG
jgi:hypothetical protein